MNFKPHPIAHGYAKGNSIASNANVHVGASRLLHIDVVNFFSSISREAVVEALRREINFLGEFERGVIADLCCHKGSLPTGSPASPILSNMVCFPLDQRLEEIAASSGCKVARFSDDICFSTTQGNFPPDLVDVKRLGARREPELGENLPALLASHRFEINWEKVRVEFRGGRMRVTGLVVGEDGISVPREFRDNVRIRLHWWERGGLVKAARRQCRARCTRAFVTRLRGCIGHIGNIEGADSVRFQRFSQAFSELLDRDRKQLCPIIDARRQTCRHSRRSSL